MNTKWPPHEETPSSSASSHSHHSSPSSNSSYRSPSRHSFTSGMGIFKQILKDVTKKHKTSLFVPASENGVQQSGYHSPKPAPVFDPSKPSSASVDCPGMLSPPSSVPRRQISEPHIRNRDHSLPSLAVASGGLSELRIDTDGHAECAGSGLDYVTMLSPDDFSPYRASDLILRERAMAQVATIHSLVDERNRMLHVIEDDNDRLEKYLAQEAKKYPGFDDLSKRDSLLSEISRMEEQLKLMHQKNPDLVPPPVPGRPTTFRTCPCCTVSNDTTAYRCKECLLSLRIDPEESLFCEGECCKRQVDRLQVSNVPDSDWLSVNKCSTGH